MKTNIDVDQAPSGSGYTLSVTRIDGQALKLHFGTAERTAEVAKFLIEAVSQEVLGTIEEAHRRTLSALDKVTGAH